MKDLKQTTVIGLGLLGGSIGLSILHSFSKMKVIGYTHRASTRRKARQLSVATEVTSDIKKSVANSDIVILATPICTFEKIFEEIAGVLPKGCIVTDVGSTKILPHKWAEKKLPKNVYYVGSHPIAGSEQRGVEFARDDLMNNAVCILTATAKTNPAAKQTLKKFWSKLGCNVEIMTPTKHDRILANVSHLPHITAVALINASNLNELEFAGKGFIDTSRIASGAASIWTDVLMTNANNTVKGIDKIIGELEKLKKAINNEDKNKIENLLEKARMKREKLIKYKIRNKEIVS